MVLISEPALHTEAYLKQGFSCEDVTMTVYDVTQASKAAVKSSSQR